MTSQPVGFSDKVAFIWSVADLLRGDFKAHEYGQVILPFTVLRRLECALAPAKQRVMDRGAALRGKISNVDAILQRAAGHRFYNLSPLDLDRILQDPGNAKDNLATYLAGFSPSAQEVLDRYGFPDKIDRLHRAGLLYRIVARFAELDLSERAVSNESMGLIFEELLRRFSEMSNETAGEHFTPREVIRLMVNVLFASDDAALTGAKPVRTLADPACGTGGMLTVAQEHLRALNPEAVLEVYGEEINPETWAICRSDLMIQDQDASRVVLGNSLTGDDGHASEHFDYLLANPPFGVDWKKYAEPIQHEHAALGFDGRYGPGLPRVSDGSLLFLLHMLAKMKPVADRPETPYVDGGTRLAIVLSGSPLFAGAAGGGESEIRRWIIENDWL
jgi:type I restriction enzyme M protein